jgi:hypothetical protein
VIGYILINLVIVKKLPNGEFEDINKVIMKKILYTYEILPKLEELILMCIFHINLFVH